MLTLNVEEYRSIHLPYIMGAMEGHKKLCGHPKMCDDQGGYNQDPNILTASFIGSVMAGRMLLHFVGVDVDEKSGGTRLRQKQRGKRSDDLDMRDLGGTLANVGRLNADGDLCDLLVGFLKMAHKAGAHMTIPEERPWPRTLEALSAIRRIVDECRWK